jgi:bifunctional DNase/RNase
MIRMVVDRVGLDVETEQAIVLLKDLTGQTVLPILVGPAEATAIALSVQGLRANRPLTCDLLKDVIDRLDARVTMALVSDLKEHTFIARLVLERTLGSVELDCRPSDAIALALRADAPIFVSESVLAEAGVATEDPGTVH